MQIFQKSPSPNHDPHPITVEFLVLHYTATSLEDTLAIFSDPQKRVSSHLVIDTNGHVYETVSCLSGQALQAWHCGQSFWQAEGQSWTQLNSWAIGIELVNLNGQIFPFTEAQYKSLALVMTKLKSHYPALRAPSRILGHEHIAGFRGKVDPGLMFDWQHFFALAYPGEAVPKRESVCPRELQEMLYRLQRWAPQPPAEAAKYWSDQSLCLETINKLLQARGSVLP